MHLNTQTVIRGAVVASLIVFSLLLITACGDKQRKQYTAQKTSVDYTSVNTPSFSADSALAFLSHQLEFGFRNPGSKGHDACAKYLHNTMAKWCDTVISQPFTTELWNGQSVKGINIISSINPSSYDRILLCAHWDSRLWADHDPDKNNHHSPILGANDGASGVALLMEMARAMSQKRPSVGIDFIFFDVEDQGLPEWAEVEYRDNTWCKGSQYWASNPHRPFYRATYGILFDMVATPEPRFTKEEISRRYAQIPLDKIWTAANILGYGQVFVNQNTDAILDDHMYINQIAGIPTIDIVQNSPECSFFKYWHTVGDNLDAVNGQSMKLVADVVMKVIYNDYGEPSDL